MKNHFPLHFKKMGFLSNKDTYLLYALILINKIFQVTIHCLETTLFYVKVNFSFKNKKIE